MLGVTERIYYNEKEEIKRRQNIFVKRNYESFVMKDASLALLQR